MKTMRTIVACGLLAALSFPAAAQTPLGTAFTYQGRLKDAGIPADGVYDLRFRLYDAAAGGSQVGTQVCQNNVSLSDGLFTVELDFGAQFVGQERFLEIDARPDTGLDCGNPAGFVTLAPRQRLTAAPNALFSRNADLLDGLDSTAFLLSGASAGGDLSGTYPNPTVARLQTRPVSSTAPSSGQVLKWTGTMWAPSADNDTTYSAGAGLQLSGNTFSIATGGVVTGMLADLAVTTAKLADGAVTSAKIADGTIATADIANGAVTDAKLSTTGVTAGTYGSATQVGVFTVNAQGRITSASNVTISGVSPGGSAGGDLSGTYPNPTVTGLQTRPVSSTAPSSGQVLKWTGTMWAPSADNDTTYSAGAGLQLSGNTFSIATGGVVTGMLADLAVTTAKLADGAVTSAKIADGTIATADIANGAVTDAKLSTTGVTAGTYGSATQVGVFTVNAQGRITSASNVTISGVSPGGSAGGDLSGTYPNPTVTGLQTRPVSSTAPSSGQVLKWMGTRWAPAADDVGGLTLPFSGSANVGSGAVFSITNTASSGTSGIGVVGHATATSGSTYGGWFQSNSTSGIGVVGWATATSGTTYGVYGRSESPDGLGVFGYAIASSGTNYGGWFRSDSTSGRGVFGEATANSGFTYGVRGQSASPDGRGVFGWATATSGGCWGVYGSTSSSASNAYGVRGDEPSGSSGHAVYANGSFAATGTKSFQIDHPLFPETHYLNHFCTEGPEPYNVYQGNVVTDAKGYATIQLPDYFESINRDPTYHLTVVDGAGEDFVLVRVVREIQNNQFTIRTSAPHVKVSWRVEAVRNDRYVQQYGFQTVQEKEDEIKGKYVQPELYGMPKEYGIHYRPEIERPDPERERPHPEPPAPAGDAPGPIR